jgi:hypothetical protein
MWVMGLSFSGSDVVGGMGIPVSLWWDCPGRGVCGWIPHSLY